MNVLQRHPPQLAASGLGGWLLGELAHWLSELALYPASVVPAASFEFTGCAITWRRVGSFLVAEALAAWSVLACFLLLLLSAWLFSRGGITFTIAVVPAPSAYKFPGARVRVQAHRAVAY